MTDRRSAGILLFRRRGADPEVLLGHMGGPFWARKDAGAWTIPKGEFPPEENPRAAARREFAEEVGSALPDGPMLDLGDIRQSGGKRVIAWAVEGDLDASKAVSNTFPLEWPRGSGEMREFPELDTLRWCGIDEARRLLVKGQVAFVDRLLDILASP